MVAGDDDHIVLDMVPCMPRLYASVLSVTKSVRCRSLHGACCARVIQPADVAAQSVHARLPGGRSAPNRGHHEAAPRTHFARESVCVPACSAACARAMRSSHRLLGVQPATARPPCRRYIRCYVCYVCCYLIYSLVVLLSGDLFYLDVILLDRPQQPYMCVSANHAGFFVNRSTSAAFNGAPAAEAFASHTLVDLLNAVRVCCFCLAFCGASIVLFCCCCLCRCRCRCCCFCSQHTNNTAPAYIGQSAVPCQLPGCVGSRRPPPELRRRHPQRRRYHTGSVVQTHTRQTHSVLLRLWPRARRRMRASPHTRLDRGDLCM